MRNQDSMQESERATARVVDLIDIERIRADINYLCSAPRNSVSNLEWHTQANQYVAAALSEAGCDVQRQEFIIPAEPTSRPGLNIIGTLNAADNTTRRSPALLIGAHYDTVPGSPGADDNASGVAVMLECARVLANVDRKRPLIFAAFDAEERQPEVGLHGSTAFVRSLNATTGEPPVSTAFILEMVGYSSPEGSQEVPTALQLVFPRAFDRLAKSRFAGDSVVVISDWKSRGAARKLEEASCSINEGVPILPIEIPRWMPIPHNLRRSDHAPFWNAGIPAVMIGDTANFRNPNYHEESDTPETLDYEFIEKVTRTLVATLAHGVTAIEPTRKPRVKLR